MWVLALLLVSVSVFEQGFEQVLQQGLVQVLALPMAQGLVRLGVLARVRGGLGNVWRPAVSGALEHRPQKKGRHARARALPSGESRGFCAGRSTGG